ncbi:MAG: cytochrome c oxidase subunit II [Acidobacteriia bacterium]|nr:cytochrome c oxidase subunit II [Terriglobia bacterium]
MASWLDPQSPEAQAIVRLFASYLVIAVTIFLIVSSLIAYSLIRYRARAGTQQPRQVTGSRPLEFTWTAIPLLIVASLFVLTVRTMAFVDAPQDLTANPGLLVTGHQWWWEARYPNGATAVNEIHIPTGTRLLARIDAADVIHDFWVPQLARKIDAVPGRPSFLWLDADAPGTYQGTCAEFCGMQHAGMRFQVIAEPPAVFSAWVEAQAQTPPEPTGGPSAAGARIFRDQKCGECHAVSAADRAPRNGPPLTHIAGRNRLAGDLANTPENIGRWILTPQAVKPGNRMPAQHLSNTDAAAVTAYLESLR